MDTVDEADPVLVLVSVTETVLFELLVVLKLLEEVTVDSTEPETVLATSFGIVVLRVPLLPIYATPPSTRILMPQYAEALLLVVSPYFMISSTPVPVRMHILRVPADGLTYCVPE